MGLHNEYENEDAYPYQEPEYNDDENSEENLLYKKDIRRRIEDRMEQRRLKLELEDFDGELSADFDWDDIK